MKINLFLFLFLSCTFGLAGQISQDLIAHHSFDQCDAMDNSGNNNHAEVFGNPDCVCGIESNSFEFSGTGDHLELVGPYTDMFKGDFTLSFYIKPESSAGRQEILTNYTDCGNKLGFSIQYESIGNSINALYVGPNGEIISMTQFLDEGKCWQHVVLTREGRDFNFYLNGSLRETSTSSVQLDLSTTDTLYLSGSTCVPSELNYFNGFIDEIQIYRRPLTLVQLNTLYYQHEEILNPDTIIYLGGQVNIRLSPHCADSYMWSPGNGILNTTEGEPIISPVENTQYELQIQVGTCFAKDEIQISVIDPNDVSCNNLLLPKAFTANRDGLNDIYFISNAYLIEDLIAFEIFDRWGGRVFYTNDKNQGWDGNFGGKELNAGVYIYKIEYQCEGSVRNTSGSFIMIR